MKNQFRSQAGNAANAALRLTWRAELMSVAVRRLIALAAENQQSVGQRLLSTAALAPRKPVTALDGLDAILIATSGLFDPGFYLAANKDVAESGTDPLEHYVNHGGTEGRAPSAAFDGALYLASYEDVKAAGGNPLAHFIKFGSVEGRTAGCPDVYPIPVGDAELPKQTRAGMSPRLFELIAALPASESLEAVHDLQTALVQARFATEQMQADARRRNNELLSLREELARVRAAGEGQRAEVEMLRRGKNDAELKLEEANSALARAAAEGAEIGQARIATDHMLGEMRSQASQREGELLSLREELAVAHETSRSLRAEADAQRAGKEDSEFKLYAANATLQRAVARNGALTEAHRTAEQQLKTQLRTQTEAHGAAERQLRSELQTQSEARDIVEQQLKAELQTQTEAHGVAERQLRGELQTQSEARDIVEQQLKAQLQAQAEAHRIVEEQLKAELQTQSEARAAAEYQLKAQLQTLAEELANSRASIELANSSTEGLRTELQSRNKDLLGLREELDAAVAAGQARLAELEANGRAQLDQLRNAHMQELSDAKVRHDQLGAEFSTSRSQAESLKGEINRLETERRDEMLQIATLRAKFDLQEAELNRLRLEERRLDQMRAELEEARIQAVRLEGSALRASEDLDRVKAEYLERTQQLEATRRDLELAPIAATELSHLKEQIGQLSVAVAASAPPPAAEPPASFGMAGAARQVALDTLRRAADLPTADAHFDVPLFQKFAYKLVLAAQTSQADNLDKAYPPFSEVLDERASFTLRIRFLLFVVANWSRLARAYHALASDSSKNLFMQLLLFRSLGHRHVRLPTNTEDFWELRRWSNALDAQPSEFRSLQGGSGLKRHALDVEGRAIDLDCLGANVFFTFGVEQYYYTHDGIRVAPSPGDHVIDAGTCFGDTAVRMAISVGREGRVYSFDPLPAHRTIAERNVTQNRLGNVRLIPFGLSDVGTEGGPLREDVSHVVDPGFAVTERGDEFPLRSIDQLVEDGTIARIDFIKMDVEGSELDILRGARNSLKRFKPKLALSMYHKWEDYFTLLEFVDSLNLGYAFYIDNYTISDAETVLYCVARERPDGAQPPQIGRTQKAAAAPKREAAPSSRKRKPKQAAQTV